MNEASEADVTYEDVPFVSYEYPSRYRKLIQEGTRFVYYRGRRRAGGGRQPQVYLGAGVIGVIRPSRTPGRLVCEVLDGERFPEPVPFKDKQGDYLEPGGSRSGYYQQGVRKVSEEVFTAIISRGATAVPQPPPASSGRSSTRRLYASPEDAREVERCSRTIVTGYLLERFPSARIVDMPTNNPGFDLETDVPSLRYVEVKGTRGPLPEFHLSEGERRFAAAHQDTYLFAVVYGIELSSGAHTGISTVRAPLGSAQRLVPQQWTGLLPTDTQVDMTDL
ncbi:MAG TPA: DUF3883 domain-containing protein [Solirubrobacterales bacterium]|nr:DUF3883 domain-containing protein [Solirubrobacterales bacterium]